MRPLAGFALATLLIAAVIALQWWSTPEAAASRQSPLESAVAAFNDRASTHPIGKHQAPLTADEVIGAIGEWQRGDGPSSPRDVAFAVASIGENRVLTSDAQLKTYTQWSRAGNYHMDVWWIYLAIAGEYGDVHVIPIRQSLPREFDETPPEDATWGPPADNGLQAACYLVPAWKHYALGSTVACRVAIRNAGAAAMELRMPSLDADLRCTARDDESNAIAVARPASNPGPRHVKILLASGESQVLYHTPPLLLGHAPDRADKRSHTIACQADQTCRVSWDLDVNVVGAQSATLRTGEIEFTVVPPAAELGAPLSRDVLSPLPDDELIGELDSTYRDSRPKGPLVAEFRTVRGSTPTFGVEVTTKASTEKEEKLGSLIRDALAKMPPDKPIIRIRTDATGRPDPETWELIRTAAGR